MVFEKSFATVWQQIYKNNWRDFLHSTYDYWFNTQIYLCLVFKLLSEKLQINDSLIQ
jgi:hypothetical protein